MQISELSRRTGVSVHAIRHYEQLGLITALRKPSGYRAFDEQVIRELRFIVMSRQCGFSLKEVGEVLPAYRQRTLTAAHMIALLRDRIAAVDAEIVRRRALRKHLVSHIAWFEERQTRAPSKSPFPRVPSTHTTSAGKKTTQP